MNKHPIHGSHSHHNHNPVVSVSFLFTGCSPLLFSKIVLFPFVEQICSCCTKIDDFRTSISLQTQKKQVSEPNIKIKLCPVRLFLEWCIPCSSTHRKYRVHHRSHNGLGRYRSCTHRKFAPTCRAGHSCRKPHTFHRTFHTIVRLLQTLRRHAGRENNNTDLKINVPMPGCLRQKIKSGSNKRVKDKIHNRQRSHHKQTERKQERSGYDAWP
jgi:hypothetical protein